MPLRHVLYRCPLCGHDPTEGHGDEVRCPACEATFVRARRGISVRGADGTSVRAADDPSNMSMAELVDRIRSHGGPLTAATHPSGAVCYDSQAVCHGTVNEEPVWKGGRLLGYVERPGPAQQGLLEVTRESLSFHGPDGHDVHWSLGEVTALQVSTRSLQIGIGRGGTVQITFPDASTFRWEELLHHLIQEVWRGEGRGEIAEFQPRITGR